MKTHVRIKLGWSKLVLISAVLAVVAMLSVIGLCFTNANADDTADPANAVWEIPVTDLGYIDPSSSVLYVGETNWAQLDFPAPDPPAKAVDVPSFNITDADIKWIDLDKKSNICLQGNILVVRIAGQDTNNNQVYKTWSFQSKGKLGNTCYIVDDKDNKPMKISANPIYLDSVRSYQIYFGMPDAFNIKSATPDVTKITGDYTAFYGGVQPFNDISLPTIFELTGQVSSGTAYYIPDAEQGYPLILEYKDVLGRSSTYKIQFNAKTSNYNWQLNGEPVSDSKSKPTKLNVGQYNANSFIINKEAAPEPITDFKVKGTIKDVDGNPIPNATVGFYNAEMDADLEEPMVSALTDENGYFVLEGCSTGKDPESGLKITYAAKHYGMDEFPFDYKDIIAGEVTLTNIPELEPALVDLYSDSPHHKSFTITEVRQEIGKEPEIRFSRNLEYYGISDLSSNGIDNPIFNISDNGVLVNTDDEGTTLTITPNGQDGYIFDNYVINDKTTYRVGDSVDIMQIVKEDRQAKISTNYTVDTSKIAKTGDENIYAIVALIAIVATVGTLLVLRRRKQDF